MMSEIRNDTASKSSVAKELEELKDNFDNKLFYVRKDIKYYTEAQNKKIEQDEQYFENQIEKLLEKYKHLHNFVLVITAILGLIIILGILMFRNIGGLI